MAKEKLVTIVMPVGENAGHKVKVTEEQAERIHGSFGEYRAPKVTADLAALMAENAELKAQVAALEAALDSAAKSQGGQDGVTGDE